MTDKTTKEKQRLRSYLNPSIDGPNTDAILEAIAHGTEHLVSNVEAINNSLYIVTSQGSYLDQRMSDRNITRPDNVGLSDDLFIEIGIQISNRKQVRDLILNILRIMYGEEFTRATINSSQLEPYALKDGDRLIIQYDDKSENVEVNFDSSQFSNIASATAQEVADAITKKIRRLGKNGSALAKDNGSGGYIELISETDGPASSIRVMGGRAQNVLKFPEVRPTSAAISTQWTLELIAGGIIRATWSGGADPSIGKIRKNDYVNIFGTSFNSDNRGTFTITRVHGGLINDAYVEFENPNGISETVVQGTNDAILFYNPVRKTINSKVNFATAYQVESRILEIFLPATTKVVRRDRKGSAHIHDTGASGTGNEGPYIYDTSKPYIIGQESALTTSEINSSTSRIINVDNSSEFPDSSGFLVFGFGTQLEEGPIPYIARPSSSSLIVDPSYIFKNVHSSGTDVALISQNYAIDPASDGSDYQLYITDVVSGRLYAEDTINLVAATGINIIINILYPNPVGLENWQATSDIKKSKWQQVFGPDPS